MSPLFNAVLLSIFAAGHAWGGLEGYSNTLFGIGAGSVGGDDDGSVFIGRYAGFANTTGGGNTFLGAQAGYSNTTGNSNIFLGSGAGFSNTTGSSNIFLGNATGHFHTTGYSNTFLGHQAGFNNTTGYHNTFLGDSAGDSNTIGSFNTFLGNFAGQANTIGSSNVFLGFTAGYSEIGSNRLYIANGVSVTPLIYGEFDNFKLTLNGNLEVVGPNAGLVRLTDVKTNTTTKGARLVLNHYNNASLPVYLLGATSTPTQNFLAFGGGNAIGNAATQLDFFTGSTTTTATGTSRMTINGVGHIGMGVTSPVHPLQMASGALVTTGGVWTNASSRDYKENIKDLSTKEASLTLASLTPVTYNYKVDKGQAHVGFIAEDVPELVATKNRKGLSPMDIVAVLTKVVKEQQRVIDEQQKLAQTQEKTIAELKEQFIPQLAQELKKLKQEVHMGRVTAVAE